MVFSYCTLAYREMGPSFRSGIADSLRYVWLDIDGGTSSCALWDFLRQAAVDFASLNHLVFRTCVNSYQIGAYCILVLTAQFTSFTIFFEQAFEHWVSKLMSNLNDHKIPSSWNRNSKSGLIVSIARCRLRMNHRACLSQHFSCNMIPIFLRAEDYYTSVKLFSVGQPVECADTHSKQGIDITVNIEVLTVCSQAQNVS